LCFTIVNGAKKRENITVFIINRYCTNEFSDRLLSLSPIGVLNGKVGDDNVCTEFTEHYKSVFHPNTHNADEWFKTETLNLLRQNSAETASLLIDVHTNNKASGINSICNEHLKYAAPNMLVHLCLLFNALLRHAVVPSGFCFGMIVLLLKDEHSDASKVDMYRGITLSCVISKLFEHVLLALFGDSLNSNKLTVWIQKSIAIDFMLCLSLTCQYDTLLDEIAEFTVQL